MGVIDDHGRCSVHIERHVANDANDLELSATRGNPMPDHAFERHVRKGCSSKVGAHHGAGWNASVIARVESTPREYRNCECREGVPADCALLHIESVRPSH